MPSDEENLKQPGEFKREPLKSPDSKEERLTWRERFKFRSTFSRENSSPISQSLEEKTSLKVEEEVKSPKSRFPKQDSENVKNEKPSYKSRFAEKERTPLLKSFSGENSKDIQREEKLKSPGIQEVRKGWQHRVRFRIFKSQILSNVMI